MSFFQTAARAAAIACALVGSVSIAHAQAVGKSVQQLEQELAARDAIIADLVRRVRALEERADPQGRAPVAAASAQPSREPAGVGLKVDQPAETAVDDETLARALERSLVLSGAVLLAAGKSEIAPGLRYDYNRRSGLGIVGGAVTTRDARRDNHVASLGVKVGLPWTSQLEVTLPFVYQKVESITGGVSSTADDSGIGDIQVGLSKHLLAETRTRPGLIGNVTWQHSTGRSNLGLLANPPAGVPLPSTSLGIGYDVLSTTLTAVKRTDPLVFLASVSHGFNRSTHAGGASIDPGDTNSATVRAILAASPSVSLRGGFSVARTGNTRVNGLMIQGSRQTIGLLELGGSVVLTRSTLLDFLVAAGLTQDSPDFLIGVSLPIRF